MRVVRSIACAAALALAGPAAAADWPQGEPIRLIVPFPAGSTPDQVARMFAESAGPRLGQTILIDNRSGAGGMIGAEAAAKAAPDGRTLLAAINGPIAVNQFLYPKMPYDPERDLAPIALLAGAAQVLVVSPTTGVKDLAGLKALAARTPGGVLYAHVGPGSASNLAFQALRAALDVPATGVAYRGFAQSFPELYSGQVQALIATTGALLGQIRDGRLTPLLITAAARSALLPDVPTAAEAGQPALEGYAWIGLFAPSATPRPILARLEDEARAFHAAAGARLAEQGYAPLAPVGAEFARFIAEERVRAGALIRAAGITAE